MYQQKLAEKETAYINVDNELRGKRREYEKVKTKLEILMEKQNSSMNKSFDAIAKNTKVINESVDFEELMNTSMDVVQKSKIGNLKSAQRDSSRSPSVPRLDFKNVKEFQEQDWLSYSKKLEDSIKVLNQRIIFFESENDKANDKYHKVTNQNTKLYEVNEKLNIVYKQLQAQLKEAKDKYKAKAKKSKECSFCNNMVEMSMSNFTMTYDKVNVSFDTATINNSF